MTEQGEPELLARVVSGDRDAFRELVTRYENMLFDLAFRLTGSRQDSEDLVQEAFIRIFQSIKRCDPRRKFGTWAYSIALNLTRNHLRRRSLLRFLSLDFRSPQMEDGKAGPLEPADPSRGPALRLEDVELSGDFDRTLAAMPLQLKEAFVLFYFHEQDVRSIAEALGASENAVKLRLMRARRFLSEKLSKNHPELFG